MTPIEETTALRALGAEKRAGPRVGLALGGGAARCVAHIGVLQVFEEHRIPIHLIAGTSGGSLVGALYAAGLDPKWMEQLADRMNWRHLVKLNLRRDGLLETEGLERFVATLIKNQTFEELRLPMAAVAVDLVSGEEVILDRGHVAPAVRASSSIPGVFVPVRHKDQVLVDGGVRNNVPANVVRRMGADVVIAVDVSGREGRPNTPPKNLVQVIMGSYDIMQRDQLTRLLQSADVVVRPNADRISFYDLDHTGDFVAAGREAALEMLPQIWARIEEAERVLDRLGEVGFERAAASKAAASAAASETAAGREED